MHPSFTTKERNGVVYGVFPLFEQTGLVRHGFSTRIGGVSSGECATMNLSFSRKDEPGRVRENYARLCAALCVPPESLVVTRQVHGVWCHTARASDAGRLVVREEPVETADALITNEPGLTLIKHFADCVPVYLLDPVGRAIGLVHAGWRGTAERIAAETIRIMEREYGTRPADLLAAIGPSIGPCCFEVGEDVAAVFDERFPGCVGRSPGRKPHVDLWQCNLRTLSDAGVLPGRIAAARRCTACEPELFYSHRRDRGHTGTMAAALALRPHAGD